MSQIYPRLVWFRHDLRLADNPALASACESGEPVVAVYFVTRETSERHHVSPRRIALITAAVRQLADGLARLGIPLMVFDLGRFSEVPDKLASLVASWAVTHVYINGEYALDERRRDRLAKSRCRDLGVNWQTYHGSVMQIPGSIKTQQGEPYKVYTAFKNTWHKQWQARYPLPVPNPVAAPIAIPSLAALAKDSGQGEPAMPDNLPTTEQQASQRLTEFIQDRIENYKIDRDIPGVDGTSQLSSSLMSGLLSPLQCLAAAQAANEGELQGHNEGISSWINELIWREFYIHVIYAFPDVCKGYAFRRDTDAIPWRHDEAEFTRWCEGKTGYPLVDAAMRQLNNTGWMHNRLRMVTAIFLSKYLFIDWRWGERYFMQQLVDGHFAANNGGWQWSASTGTDAVPYFRLLSPVRQAERFDPAASFIKSQIPELAELQAKVILTPGHKALIDAGYPGPMVDLKLGRERCMNTFKSVRNP